jgi:signal transduction histidine kinase/CheY-like chemotaxis protein
MKQNPENIFHRLKKLSIYPALKVAIIYFIISFLWIFFSDRLVELIAKDLSNYSNIQTIKGLGFVVATTLIILFLIRREIREKNAIIETINESEQWYNILFSNIPNVDVFLFDSEMNFILAQGTGFKENKISSAEIRGKNLRELDLGKEFTAFLKREYSKILTGSKVKEQVQFNNRWYELRGAPLFDHRSNVFAGISIFINITEFKDQLSEINNRKKEYENLYEEYQEINEKLIQNNEELNNAVKKLKESEAKYKAFISQTTEGIYRFELPEPIPVNEPVEKQIQKMLETSYLAECNDAFANIYGKEKKELLNISLAEFQNQFYVRQGKDFIKKFIESGYQLKNAVNEEKNGAGKKIYLNKNITGIIINNELTSAWGSQSDITDRKQYEKALVRAKHQAEESDQLKSAFLANMSHEIRTPLNGILGFSHLLTKNNLSKNQKEKFVSIIKNNGKQLLNLINDILDISKLEARQLKIFESEFSLNELMKEIKTLFQNDPKLQNKEVTLHAHQELKKGNDYILADQERISQIFQNLINNAIKFTEEGRIDFGYKKEENRVIFYVKDTGMGIAKEKQQEIFNRFQQEESSFKTQAGGTGLGLSISKGLIELMDGTIWVESAEGKGSSFFFSIPYKPGNSNKAETAKTVPSKKYQEKTILIVEDDQHSYQLLLAFLKEYQSNVLSAVDGIQAVKTVKENPEIDLILMDIRLPRMDGLEATKEIKKINPNIPVIAQSAYAMSEDRKKSSEAGCDDFIPKPIERDKFFELIEKYLG